MTKLGTIQNPPFKQTQKQLLIQKGELHEKLYQP